MFCIRISIELYKKEMNSAFSESGILDDFCKMVGLDDAKHDKKVIAITYWTVVDRRGRPTCLSDKSHT